MNLGEVISNNQDIIKMALVAAVVLLAVIGLFKNVGKLLKFAFKVVIVAAVILLVVFIYRKIFVPV